MSDTENSLFSGTPTRRALQLAYAADAAYAMNPAQSEFWRGVPVQHFQAFAGSDDLQPAGYLAVTKVDIVLAFRGTTQVADWVINFDARQIEVPYGRVHRGFLAALDTIWPTIAAALAAYGSENRQLWLTGHSLGGALAVLSAARLTRPITGLTTFGQPRVGDQQFASQFAPSLLRLTTVRDLVPKLPLGLMSAYRHCGECWQLTDGGQIVHRADDTLPWGEMLQLMQILTQREKRGEAVVEELLKPALAEHGMSVYLDRLRKAHQAVSFTS